MVGLAINELEWMWKETAVAHLKHLPCKIAGLILNSILAYAGGAAENYTKFQSEWSIFRPETRNARLPNTSHNRYLPFKQT
jgi:hypothetical protein